MIMKQIKHQQIRKVIQHLKTLLTKLKTKKMLLKLKFQQQNNLKTQQKSFLLFLQRFIIKNQLDKTISILHVTLQIILLLKMAKLSLFVILYGQATTAKGYQKADIFDKDGNKKKGLGGGNCQISTTLYNAVLAVPSLSVTERHAHSNYVPYIQKGKDAAVAYGSYDFKFVNNSGNDIVIHCSSNGSTVDVSLNIIRQ